MKHIFEQKVFYADTDAYGVVWHGSYLRWMEMGRVMWCEDQGYTLNALREQDIVLPVVNINVKYKASAKLEDVVIIETWIEKFNPLSVTFRQTIKSKETGRLFIEAFVDVVALHEDGKLYRKMPEILTNIFERALQCPVLV
ncbi:acyl-CoA thioesterase [bacterium]|nr:acyl-CoA thioesterase [bacterium]